MNNGYIPLPGRLPSLAWFVHAVVGALLAGGGLAAIRSGSDYWLDWVKVIFGALTLSGMIVVAWQRMRHGPPRMEPTEHGLRVRTGQFTATQELTWADVERIVIRNEEVQLSMRGGDSVYASTLSPATCTAVRQLLESVAADRGIELTTEMSQSPEQA